MIARTSSTLFLQRFAWEYIINNLFFLHRKIFMKGLNEYFYHNLISAIKINKGEVRVFKYWVD